MRSNSSLQGLYSDLYPPSTPPNPLDRRHEPPLHSRRFRERRCRIPVFQDDPATTTTSSPPQSAQTIGKSHITTRANTSSATTTSPRPPTSRCTRRHTHHVHRRLIQGAQRRRRSHIRTQQDLVWTRYCAGSHYRAGSSKYLCSRVRSKALSSQTDTRNPTESFQRHLLTIG